ncbi:MAG: response regulator transcription factor [Chloroflexi bacterium]|nr:response regulator transcription factor [Chloroflexota bacterium]
MPSQPCVLVVDDEAYVTEMLKEWLEEEGYRACTASNATEGLKLFYDCHPDAVVVDLLMPGMDGFQLIGRIRELSQAPVLVLTALSGDDDIVRGLDLGADEYVVKPVSRNSFLARVRSLLRRGSQEGEETGSYTDPVLSLDTSTHSVSVKGQEVHLSPLEFRLLAYLVHHRHRVVTHDELLNRVWGSELGSLESLKWYTSSLRRKLEAGSPGLVVNVRTVGYRYLPPQAPE